MPPLPVSLASKVDRRPKRVAVPKRVQTLFNKVPEKLQREQPGIFAALQRQQEHFDERGRQLRARVKPGLVGLGEQAVALLSPNPERTDVDRVSAAKHIEALVAKHQAEIALLAPRHEDKLISGARLIRECASGNVRVCDLPARPITFGDLNRVMTPATAAEVSDMLDAPLPLPVPPPPPPQYSEDPGVLPLQMPPRMPPSLREFVEEDAQEQGISLDDFCFESVLNQ